MVFRPTTLSYLIFCMSKKKQGLVLCGHELTSNYPAAPLFYAGHFYILWVSRFLKNVPATASPFLKTTSTSSRPSRFLVPRPNPPTDSYSPVSAVPTCTLQYPAMYIITCTSTNSTILSSFSLKAIFSVSALSVPPYNPCLLTTRASRQPVPPYNPCLQTTRASLQPVPPYNPCLQTTRASLQPVPPDNPCLLTTRASLQPVPPDNPCLLTTRASLQPVPPYNLCLLTTRAFRQPVSVYVLAFSV